MLPAFLRHTGWMNGWTRQYGSAARGDTLTLRVASETVRKS